MAGIITISNANYSSHVDKRTQECHLWAAPQSRQHLFHLRLFANKHNRWADEQKTHVAVNGVTQE